MAEAFVYKALRPEEIAPSEAEGVSRARVDAADGYVHLSSRAQIGETLARHFAGLDGVKLYEFATESLGPDLRWEPSRGGALFPHLHGDLALSGARRSWTLASGPDGVPALPPEL